MEHDRSWRLGLYEKSMPGALNLGQKLAAAKRAGYDHLELSIDESDEKLARLDWTAGQCRELVEAMFREELPIRSICLSGHRRYPLGDPDANARRESLAIMQKAVALAARLGVRLIQIAGYDVYYKDPTPRTRALFGEGLRQSVDMAAAAGVTLAFETMETPFLDTVEKAMEWVDAMQSPYLQIYPDTGNLANAALLYGTPLAQDMAKGRGHIAALHLKETRPGIYREVAYGEGHVDFAAAVGEAQKQGVRLFTAEFWHLGETDWPDVLAANRAFLQAHLQAAFEA